MTLTPERLRLIADWLDTYDDLALAWLEGRLPVAMSNEDSVELRKTVTGKEIQNDLRQWADRIEVEKDGWKWDDD